MTIVRNEDENEEELPSGMSALVSGGGTPNKKRKGLCMKGMVK